ncbi:MAG: aldehyde dehydrogenase family protein [Psittacicella sp.]
MKTTNLKDLHQLIKEVKEAQEIYSTFTQEQVDKIFKAVALAASENSLLLAEEAVKETKMGIIEDKVIKNKFSSDFIYNIFKDEKTCGVIYNSPDHKTIKIADPMGVICAIIPTTNPTSTAIFKALLALKTRNGIIFSPHPKAKNCTDHASKIMLEAAIKAGAPKNIIGWIDEPSMELSHEIMTHKDIALILATGGPSMVKAAYSSGTPAIGVGSGNVPVIIDESADIQKSIEQIFASKTFDNGVVCASEQAVIALDKVYSKIKEEIKLLGGYILNDKEKDQVAKVLFIDGNLNAKIVGQSASHIAQMAGFKVPENTKVLVGEGDFVTPGNVFAHEKLSPVLGLFKASTFENAIEQASLMLEIGGMGHTSGLHIDQYAHQDKVEYFSKKMKTGRILINMPTTHGAIGYLEEFEIAPSMTLGCGSWGKNSVSENVEPKHLLNIKTIAIN